MKWSGSGMGEWIPRRPEKWPLSRKKSDQNSHSIVEPAVNFPTGLWATGAGNSEVQKEGKDEDESRREEQAQNEATHKDHEQVADPAADAVVLLHSVIGEHIADDAAAVEGRNGQQIEEEEREVD